MKTKMTILLAALAIGASALVLNAQDNGGSPADGPRPPHRQGGPDGGFGGGPGGPGGRRPMPPIIAALDANHDGTIDETEIANAAAALKTLDKNGDGKLTPDELRPQRPDGQGPDGGEGRPHGPRGPGGPGGNQQRPPGNE